MPLPPPLRTALLALPDGPVLIDADASAFADALVAAFSAAGRSARVLRDGDESIGLVGKLVLLGPDESIWTAASENRLKRSLGLAQNLRSRAFVRVSAGKTGQANLLVTISRRDGAFGHATRSPGWNPLQGGLARAGEDRGARVARSEMPGD